MTRDPIVDRLVAGVRGLKRVRKKIKVIYLFGSRARGDEKPDSDYDFLLVVSEDFTLRDKSRLYDIVMNILLDTGRVVSLKIRKESEFQRLRSLGSPFIENILREGIQVG